MAIKNEWDQADADNEMAKEDAGAKKGTEIGRKYWLAFKDAIENYTAAVERNENGTLIHCLARVVKVREDELHRIEAEGKKGAK